MDSSHALRPVSPQLPSQERAIPPHQVWASLTADQQQHLLQAVVLICHDLLRLPSATQGRTKP